MAAPPHRWVLFYAYTGTYWFAVRAYGWLGNRGEWSLPVTLIVDTTAPSVPEGLSALTPTTNKAPTLEWEPSSHEPDGMQETAFDPVRYEVRVDGVEVFDVGTATSFTPAFKLADGAHTFQVRAYDWLGNYSEWSEPFTIVVDTLPPAAPVIEPLAPGYKTGFQIGWAPVVDTVNDEYEVTYILEWADNEGFHNAAAVVLGSDQTTWAFTPPSNGTYWFRVKAISWVNETETKVSSWSAEVHTVYDTTPPSAPVVTLMTPSPTKETPQTWSWNTPAGAVRFEVSVDNDTWVSVGDLTTYQTNFNTTGTHMFYVRAYDWLDNMGPAGSGSVVVDVTAPPVPVGLGVITPTTKKTPTWSWNPVQAADLAGYKVKLNQVEVIDIGNKTSYTHSEELGDGTHTLEVLAYDALGNESGWSERVSVTVDTLPPPAPVFFPLSPGYNTSIPVKWTAPELLAGREYPVSYMLEWANNEGFYNATPVAFGPLPSGQEYVEWLFAPPAPGTYWFRVKAIATVNEVPEVLESQWSPEVHTVFDNQGPGIPSVMRLTPSPTKDAPQIWFWTRPADATGYHFGVVASSEAVPEEWADVGNADTHMTHFTASGVYYVKVRAYDWLGNLGLWSPAASVAIDTTAPPAPSNLGLEVDQDKVIKTLNGQVFTNDNTPTVVWSSEGMTAQGFNPDDNPVKYLVYLNGIKIGETVATEYNFAAGLTDATFTVTVVAVDAAGNASGLSAGLVFTVDTTPPAVPMMPMTATPTKNTTPTWQWPTVTDAVGYKVYWNVAIGLGMVETNEYTHTVPLSEGTHYLRVSAVDWLGNESALSAPGMVVIDLTPPAAPTAPTPNANPTASGTQIWTWHGVGEPVTYEVETGTATAWSGVIESVTTNQFQTSFSGNGLVFRVRIRAIDGVGNVGSWSPEGVVFVDTVAPLAVEGLVKTTPPPVTKPVFQWNRLDDASVTHYLVWITDTRGGTTWQTTVAQPGVGPVEVSVGLALPADEYTVFVRAVDSLGNIGPEVSMGFTVSVPTVRFINLSPAPGNYAINKITHIKFDVVGYSGPGLSLEITVNEDPLIGPASIRRTTSGSTEQVWVFIPESELTLGRPLTLQVTARDEVGNLLGMETFRYEVAIRRDGFGLGRLRP